MNKHKLDARMNFLIYGMYICTVSELQVSEVPHVA